MKYYLKEWGHINGVPPIGNCLERYDSFKCHSEVSKVLTKVKQLKNDIQTTTRLSSN